MEKEIKERVIPEFPKFYIEKFLNLGAGKIDYLNSYNSYRDTLGTFTILMNGLKAEIEQRKEKAATKEYSMSITI